MASHPSPIKKRVPSLLRGSLAPLAALIATTLLHCAQPVPGPIQSVQAVPFRPLDNACNGTPALERAFFSDDGKYLAKLCSPVVLFPQTYTLALWDTSATSSAPLFTLPDSDNSQNKLLSAAFSPDGHVLVGLQSGAQLWDIPSHALLFDFSGSPVESKPASAVAFSKNGHQFAIATGSTVVVFDAEQKKTIAALDQADTALHVQQLSFSPDDAFLLGIYLDATKPNPDKKAFVWKLGSGLGSHPALAAPGIQAAAFQPFIGGSVFGDAPHNYILALYREDVTDPVFDTEHQFLSWKNDKLYFYLDPLLDPNFVLAWSPEWSYHAYIIPWYRNKAFIQTRDPEKYPLPYGSDALNATQDGDLLLGAVFSPDGRSLFVASHMGLYQWNLVRRSTP